MKKVLYFILFPIFSLGALLPAQQLAISYEIIPQSDNELVMHVYLQSLTNQDQPIRAINLSLAIPESCVKITGQTAVFSDAWTDYLQEVQITDQLDLNYNNWHYDNRWQFGSADPGLPNTRAIIAPAQDKAALLIMQIRLKGNCTDKLYLENQTQNGLNQVGDAQMQAMEWIIIHPKASIELQNGVSLQAFPNPVNDVLNIHLDGHREHAYSLELFSLEGKMIMQEQMDIEQQELKIKMDHLPNAVYVLSVRKKGEGESQFFKLKVIKK